MVLAGRLEAGRNALVPCTTPPEVDAHQPLEVVVLHGLDRGAERDARVVDDHVDGVALRDDVGRPLLDRVCAGPADYLRPSRRGRDAVDVGDATRQKGRQLERPAPPNARGGTGDGSDASVELDLCRPTRRATIQSECNIVSCGPSRNDYEEAEL